MNKHTPLPWKIRKESDGVIAIWATDGREYPYLGELRLENEANAEYIATACNAYPELIEALAELVKMHNEGTDKAKNPHIYSTVQRTRNLWYRAELALAKALANLDDR